MESIVQLPNGSIAKVAVYREDGGGLVVVGVARHETPAGASETTVATRMPIAVFEHYQEQAIRRLGPLTVSRLLGRVGLDRENLARAPMLPRGAAPGLPMLPR